VLAGTDIIWLLLAVFLLWENISPDKSLATIQQRWVINFSLLLISFVITASLNYIFNLNSTDNIDTALLSPFLRNKDLFLFLSLFLLLDLFYYLLHRIMHYYHLLWRCHCVHHSDLNVDISTNFRHHPFELILTWSLMSTFVWLIKIDFSVLAIFGGVSAIIQMWHHSNIKINAKLDNYLAYILVTPKVHRIHHSADIKHTNSNYGTIFTFWDRLFGTFTKPSNVIQPITYGLEYFNKPVQQSFIGVLKQPLIYRQNKNASKPPQELD